MPRFPSYLGLAVDKPALVVPTTAVEVAVERPAPIVSLPTPTGARYFEQDTKFWEITCTGCDVTTRWGKIGSTGQSKTKTFASPAAAAKEVAKLIESKTAGGYVEKAK